MSLFRDLKIAVRHLLRAPGFTTMAVLMLALGIGATTAIFSIVESVLLRPLPFPQSDRLMVLSDILEGTHMSNNGEVGVTAQDIRDYTRNTHSFDGLGAYAFTAYELSGEGTPDQLNAAQMTAGVFTGLRVEPLLGRVFTQQEDDQHQQVAILSYSTWRSRFHADPGVVGQKVLLDRKPYIVVGVMPRNFEFPLVAGHLNRVELWVPMSFEPTELANGSSSWSFQMVGRLKTGVIIAQATSDAEEAAKEIVRNYPGSMAGFHMHPVIRPLQEETIEDARPLVRTLFIAVLVVLLIACTNLAGLLLVRAIRRRREIAVRLALGASAFTLLRQVVLESLILSVTGGLIGIVLAEITLRVSVRFLPETLPRLNEIGLDQYVVAFALGLAVLTGVLCGLAPAFAAIRTSVNDTLKEGGRSGSSGSGHARLRSALVVAEVAIALALLAASGLLLRSFEKMREVDLGYQPDHTLVAEYGLPNKQYATQASIDQFNQDLLRRIQALPGVKSAGLTTFLPASSNSNGSVFVAEGYVPRKDAGMNLATIINVQGDYFEAMGIPLLRGRFFTPADKAGAPLALIVNHMLASRVWPGQNPIGKRMRLGTETMQMPWATVIGEVADVKENSPDAPTKPQYYASIAQIEQLIGPLATPSDLVGNSVYLAIRTSALPLQMVNTLRGTVSAMDPQLPLNQVQTMDHAIADSEAPRRFNTALITSFAVVAVMLAVLGIYSVIAFSVALRVQEIAIRMALGSQRSGIVGMIVMAGAKLALIGCAIGLAGAAAASRILRSFLFGVSAFDPLVLSMAALFVLLLALMACLLPAQRASAIDPNHALRAD